MHVEYEDLTQEDDCGNDGRKTGFCKKSKKQKSPVGTSQQGIFLYHISYFTIRS